MNFIAVTLGFIAGFLMWEYTGGFFAVCALFVLVAAAAVMKFILNKNISLNIFCTASAVCIGIIAYGGAVSGGSLNDYVNRYSTVTGRVAELPDMSGDNYRYVLDTRSIEYDGVKSEIKQNIILTSPLKYEFNDTVTAEGFIETMDGAMNEFGFDARLYYRSVDIEYKMYSENISISDTSISSYLPGTGAVWIKSKISDMIYGTMSGDNAAVTAAVLSGNRNGLSEELEDALIKSGGYRFLYSAYFFILVLTVLISSLSNKLSKKTRTYILMAAILAIGIFNSDRPVFIKSCIYTAAVMLVRMKYGYAYRPDVLCAVIFAVLLANPLLIYNGAFVISAAASAMLLIFGDAVRERLVFIKNNFVRSSVSAGLICTIGLLPLSAYYFNGIAPYSVITVFLYIPANIIIWICYWPAALMMKLFGSAPVLSQLLSLSLAAYTRLPYAIIGLPWSYIYLSTPGIIAMAVFAAGLAAVYMKLRGRKYKYAVIAAGALAAVFVTVQIPRLNTVEFTFVNVGQGDGAVVSAPYRGSILIDGGGGSAYSDYDPGEEIFVPYLISHGKTKIDAAFISHFHKDHAEGIIAAVKELDVHALFMPDSMPESELRAEAEEAARKAGTDIYYISEDTRVNFKSGITVEIIVPDERTKMSDDENDTSLLMNVSYGDVNCLFTGDMTKFGENSLLLKNRAPQAEILKVAHHGSATSTGSEWVEAVDPDISVISLGEDNMYGFPRESVIEALKDTELYRTDISGDITITADSERILETETYR